MTKPKPRKGRARNALILVVVLAAAVWGGLQLTEGEEGAGQLIQGAPVRRGPLRISVVERGNLKAADSVTLKSELEGQSTVLWLIDEGTQVQPGDLLVELDTSNLVDRRVQQEIKVQNEEASFVKAKQNYAIQQSQNESDIAGAEQVLDFAKLDLKKYLEGDMPQELQSKEEDILLADEELTRAVQDLTWSEQLAERGFLEQTQLDADRLAKTRAEIKLNQAKRAKELYESYEIPRNQKELESAVTEAERELERVSLQAKARIADYEADLRTTEATFDLESDELEKLVSQIDKSRIEAPVAGMVVYAVENRGRWGDGDPMQEGTQVRERQDIITIPSNEGYIAEASLHESVLEKVTLDMACLVTVDALQETFPGSVDFKAVLPDQGSWWSNPDLRVYRTEIRIESNEPRLRPGMSCSIEILVDELEDVTYVPVQAVFLDGGDPVCFVVQGKGAPEKRPVVVGQNNEKWVEIQSGLQEGETVLLALPPGTSLEPAGEAEDANPWGGAERKGGEGRPSSGGERSGKRPSGRPEGGSAPSADRADGSGSGEDWKKKAEQWKKGSADAGSAAGNPTGTHGGGAGAPPAGRARAAGKPAAGGAGT